MIDIYRICKFGEPIFGGGNVQICGHGTKCYHKICNGKNRHEFQAKDLEDFCKTCESRNIEW